jgi:hypothetical protein
MELTNNHWSSAQIVSGLANISNRWLENLSLDNFGIESELDN